MLMATEKVRIAGEPVDRDQAEKELRAAAWIDDRPTSPLLGRQVIHMHSPNSHYGADWDLTDALALAKSAMRVEWRPDQYRHHLHMYDGNTWRAFAVNLPQLCPDCGQTDVPGVCRTHPTCPQCPVCGYCDLCASEDA